VPCCTCRYGVIKLLINRNHFDNSRAEECLYDADSATRDVAKKWLRRSACRPSTPTQAKSASKE
jgi:hypothetical protein